MIAIEILAVLVIVAVRLRLHTRSTVDEPGSPPQETDPSVERARATVGWAEGSRLDWDRHVRPVLAREITELLRGRRDPESVPANEIGQRMLGSRLWAWVDPHDPWTTDLDLSGPGRQGLTEILDRLERL